MSLPTDEVGICNLATDYVGGERVFDIYSPTTDTEKIFSRHYPEVRQELLRSYIPNFAKKRVNLHKVTATIAGDFEDTYQLPLDFIRLLSVGGDTEADQWDSNLYDLAETTIVCNNDGAANLFIRYVADITDVAKWDAGFRRLCAIELALAVVVQITNDTKKAAYLTAKLEKKVSTVLGVDAQEKPPTVIDRSRILARRKGYGGSYDRNTNQYIYFTD